MVVMFWLFAPAGSVPGGTARLLTAVGVVMPVALTWIAVSLARAIATLRAEADELRVLRLDRMRGGAADPGPDGAGGPMPDRPAAQAASQPAPRAADAPRSAPPARAPLGRGPAPRPAGHARDAESRQRTLPLEGDEVSFPCPQSTCCAR